MGYWTCTCREGGSLRQERDEKKGLYSGVCPEVSVWYKEEQVRDRGSDIGCERESFTSYV